MSQIKYMVCYLAGSENQGITNNWDVAEDMQTAMEKMHELRKEHEFATVTIAEIKECYEFTKE
jgi:hypothetical protein